MGAVQKNQTTSHIGMMVHHLIHPLDRQQLRPGSGMARLAAAFAATALAPLRRLEPRAVTGGRLAGMTRAAADALAQLGQLARQGGELAAELLDLLRLDQDELSGLGWPRQPIRFWNPGRRRAHHRRSLPVMQP